ncbi:DUF3857 domain-containing protein [Bizionia arctica]|uniref:DUF3857 domain-containing protein n=1 Tax=Bizionia arctica TaxID=1495645 RepID=A0A917GFJ9_9FLAO|nr:DUF3857 domain-containing protein [Bizionia arctica]GGG43081.1 hypothetical protein GCM10010976_13200 [Bizionia arctica]
MKTFYLTYFLIASFCIQAQSNFNSKDYSVTLDDIQTNVFDQDSTANAIVLYEYGKSYIDDQTFNLVSEVKRKIKILNSNGFDKATISIVLHQDGSKKEIIKNIMATTYNLNGTSVIHTKLRDSDIYKEQYNTKNTITKFTLPNVKEGSVITYSYTTESPYIYNYQGWEFQDDIPKLYSEYNTSIPANYEYHIKLVGFLKLKVNESAIESTCITVRGGGYADCTVSKYVMEDVPAFIEEDYMTTKDNYLSKLGYELNTVKLFDGRIDKISKTWKDVDKELKSDSRFGRQLSVNVSNESVFPETDPLKRAESIYAYVQNKFTWNEKYNIFGDISIKDLMKTKSGNVSEINILLHNLLEENNIEVLPVLLSTRANGFTTKLFPVISEFNYLIVQATINNQTYLLDATDPYMSFGELPFRCLNGDGRLLDFKNGSTWIEISPKKTSTIQYKVDLKLEENDLLVGKVNVNATGYHAYPLKKSYYSNQSEYLKQYQEKYNLITFSDHKVTSKDKTSFDYQEEFTIEYPTENINENLYINPFLFKLMSENPFKLKDRTYPIDFGYKDAYLYTLKIDLNNNYEILEIPEEVNMSLPNNKGLLIFSTKIIDNDLVLYFKFTFNEPIYNPEYYESLKVFMSTIVDAQKNSLIVLKHK